MNLAKKNINLKYIQLIYLSFMKLNYIDNIICKN